MYLRYGRSTIPFGGERNGGCSRAAPHSALLAHDLLWRGQCIDETLPAENALCVLHQRCGHNAQSIS